MKLKAAIKAAKMLLDAIKNPEESKKKARVLVMILAVCVSTLFIVPAAAISLPGLVVKGIFSKISSAITGGDKEVEISDEDMEKIDDETKDEEFILEDSEIYKQVKQVYIKYNDDLDKKIAANIKKIEEDNTYTETIEKEDPETGEIIKEEVKKVPTISKNINLDKPKIQYVLAFISTKYLSVQTEDDEYEFDEKEIKEFLDEITTLYESTEGTDPISYTAYTIISDEYEIMNMKFSEEEFPDDYEEKQEQYLVSYESFLDLDDEQVNESAESKYDNIDLSDMEIYANGMEIPHFLQYDSRWGSVAYGNKTIGYAGCGITCMAMLLNYFGYTKSPPEVARWSMNHGYYVNGVGTSWSFFGGISNEYGITCTNIGKDTKRLIEALSSGKPVIASMAPGTFTSGGHFIVLRGITAGGKILVNDPNDNTHSKKFYKREFDIRLIMNESKNMWAFSN